MTLDSKIFQRGRIYILFKGDKIGVASLYQNHLTDLRLIFLHSSQLLYFSTFLELLTFLKTNSGGNAQVHETE